MPCRFCQCPRPGMRFHLEVAALLASLSSSISLHSSRIFSRHSLVRRNLHANEAASWKTAPISSPGTKRPGVLALARVMTPLFHVYSIAVLKLCPGSTRSALLPVVSEAFLGKRPSRNILGAIIILNENNGPDLRLDCARLIIYMATHCVV